MQEKCFLKSFKPCLANMR